jgi:hypothetical protein
VSAAGDAAREATEDLSANLTTQLANLAGQIAALGVTREEEVKEREARRVAAEVEAEPDPEPSPEPAAVPAPPAPAPACRSTSTLAHSCTIS